MGRYFGLSIADLQAFSASGHENLRFDFALSRVYSSILILFIGGCLILAAAGFPLCCWLNIGIFLFSGAKIAFIREERIARSAGSIL